MKQCTEFYCCFGGGRGNNEVFISQFNASANASEQLMLINNARSSAASTTCNPVYIYILIYNARSRPQNIFFHAVENAGSPLYCVDFVNLCRGDPHIFNSNQENILLNCSIQPYFNRFNPLASIQCSLFLAHIANFCLFLAHISSFLAYFPVQLIFEAELILSNADKFKL